jgi:hypothetical protein
VLAHSAVQPDLAEGRVSAARIMSPSISRRVAMATASARADSQACHAIAALVLQVARDLVGDGVWIGRPWPEADAHQRDRSTSA